VLPFLEEGLRQGEYCLRVTDGRLVEDWTSAFSAFGIDAHQEIDAGRLGIIDGSQWMGSDGFNSLVKAREVLTFIRNLAADSRGIRMAGDVEWELAPTVTVGQFCHWEATANLVFQDEPVRTICQFNQGRNSPDMIFGALRTHPTVIYQGQTHRHNPTYEAHLILESEPHLNHVVVDAADLALALARLSDNPR
jgi:hypothetical protein